MKVFIDTEFYEFKPFHGGVRLGEDGYMPTLCPGGNAVQLISLGAVREDGAEFYAENGLFDWDNVPKDHWLQENVRPNLWHGSGKPLWMLTQGESPAGGRYTPKVMGKTFWEFATGDAGSLGTSRTRPEFWGYSCDYDWVVLCGLYGRMVDLPPEFPMYCLDLRQEMHRMNISRHDLPAQAGTSHHALSDARWVRDAFKSMPGRYLRDS